MDERPGLIGRLWYDAAYWTSWIVFTFGFSYRGTGRWNVPKRGPALILSNHQSMFDPMLVGLSLPRYPAFLARSTLFDVPLLGPAIKSVGAVPIDRNMGKDGIVHVVIFRRADVSGELPPKARRAFSQDGKWATARWADGDKVFLVMSETQLGKLTELF